MKEVQIFEAGDYLGFGVYTEADLDGMVENFDQFSRGDPCELPVPVKTGWDGNDIGRVRLLRRSGRKLLAEIDCDVPDGQRVSIEVYTNFPEGITAPPSFLTLHSVFLLHGEDKWLRSVEATPEEPPVDEPIYRDA